jgi:hypothetical protein
MSLKGSDYAAIAVCHGHHDLFNKATKKGIGIFKEDQLAEIIAENKRAWEERK